MNHTRFLIAMILAGVAGCGSGGDSSIARTPDKIEGPNVKTLSHDQLMDVLHECHQYGSSDDPKVKYTVSYCSAAQSAHAMEGYATPGSAAVDPRLNKLH